MKNDLLRILNGSIVTEHHLEVYYLDRYSKRNKEVDDYELVKTLINIDFLEIESGNWETRERHFVINTKYVSYKDNVRYVNLKEFAEKLKNYSEMIVSNRVKEVFFSVKKSMERKYKLEKLYDKG